MIEEMIEGLVEEMRRIGGKKYMGKRDVNTVYSCVKFPKNLKNLRIAKKTHEKYRNNCGSVLMVLYIESQMVGQV